MKKSILLLLFLCACNPKEYPTSVGGRLFNTGSITTIERACVGETSALYHSCFTVACDTKLDRILYVSEHRVELTPFKCRERK